MFYRCKSFKIKDSSGSEVNIETIHEDSEVLIKVNELRGTITVYPNIKITDVDLGSITFNTTPTYIISGGSLEITEGQLYKQALLTETSNWFSKENVEEIPEEDS